MEIGIVKKITGMDRKQRFLPSELQVKNKDVYETLEPVTIPLKIKLRQVKNLRAVNTAKSSLLGFLSRGRI
jgi:hypothetical protein